MAVCPCYPDAYIVMQSACTWTTSTTHPVMKV